MSRISFSFLELIIILLDVFLGVLGIHTFLLFYSRIHWLHLVHSFVVEIAIFRGLPSCYSSLVPAAIAKISISGRTAAGRF